MMAGAAFSTPPPPALSPSGGEGLREPRCARWFGWWVRFGGRWRGVAALPPPPHPTLSPSGGEGLREPRCARWFGRRVGLGSRWRVFPRSLLPLIQLSPRLPARGERLSSNGGPLPLRGRGN